MPLLESPMGGDGDGAIAQASGSSLKKLGIPVPRWLYEKLKGYNLHNQSSYLIFKYIKTRGSWTAMLALIKVMANK